MTFIDIVQPPPPPSEIPGSAPEKVASSQKISPAQDKTAKNTPRKTSIKNKFKFYQPISRYSKATFSLISFVQTISKLIMKHGVKFEMYILKTISHGSIFLCTTRNLVISHCYFTADGKEMYQELLCICTAIVVLIEQRRVRQFLLPLPLWF